MRALALCTICAVALVGQAHAQPAEEVAPLYVAPYYNLPTVVILFNEKTGQEAFAAYNRILATCQTEATRVQKKRDLVFFSCVQRLSKEEGGFFIDGSASIMCGNGGHDTNKNRTCVSLPSVSRGPVQY